MRVQGEDLMIRPLKGQVRYIEIACRSCLCVSGFCWEFSIKHTILIMGRHFIMRSTGPGLGLVIMRFSCHLLWPDEWLHAL